jgi:hypothetical protein
MEMAFKLESHLFVFPQKFDPVAIGSALYLIMGLKNASKTAVALLPLSQRRMLPLSWPEEAFLEEEKFDYASKTFYEAIWLWGVDRPKALKRDRKENMTRKPSIRHLLETSAKMFQVFNGEDHHLVFENWEGRRSNIFAETGPGSLIELAYELGRSMSPPTHPLAWGAEHLMCTSEEAKNDPLFNQFYQRLKHESQNI